MNFVKWAAVAVMCAVSSWAYAGVGRKGNNGVQRGDFVLEHRFGIVAESDDRLAVMFANRLQSFLEGKGVAAVGLSSGMASRNIVARTVSREGDVHFCSVDVDKGMVVVEFTSAEAMNWAYSALTDSYTDTKGFFKRSSGKGDRRFAAMETTMSTAVAEQRSDVIDLVALPVDVEAVKRRLGQALSEGCATVYAVMLNRSGWKMESRTMRLVNPDDVQPAGECYSFAQIEQIRLAADKMGIELVAVIDVSSPDNKAFKSFTGHDIHSTEGVRFTRALVREFCYSTGFKNICLGAESEDETIKRRFIKPVEDEVVRSGREVVKF
ncbi:MAG: hypothetical protein K2N21_03865 [Rikenellaceae bacterium]|nr:hypothetical protein [Rikenellaceae bacterium]